MADLIWRRQVRYIGVGAMLIGGVWALWSLRKSLVEGIRSGLKVRVDRGAVAHTERDLPMSAILIGSIVFVLPLFFLYQAVVGSFGIALTMAILMIITGFLFCAVAGYMAGLVGSSNSPVSGMTICTMLFAAVVLLGLMGRDSTLGAVATVLIGAVVCTAASVAGDNLQDLKCGQLIGATPWRQQVMLAIGALASACVMAPVLNLLLKAYGIGEPAFPGAHALPAPQANLVRSVAEGMFGGHLPWDMITIGLAVGAAIIALDQWLKARKSRWSTPVLAVAVGIYLPLDVSTPIMAGGILCELAQRWHARHNAGKELEPLMRNGMLFAAGTHYRRSADRGHHCDSDRAHGRRRCAGGKRIPATGSMGRSRGAAGDLLLAVPCRDTPDEHDRLVTATAAGSRGRYNSRSHERIRTSAGSDVVACFAILYFVWGSTYVVNKFGLHQLPPLLLGGARFTVAGLIMVMLALARGARLASTRAEWRDVLIMGLLGVALSNAINLWALQYVGESVGADQCEFGLLDRGFRHGRREGQLTLLCAHGSALPRIRGCCPDSLAQGAGSIPAVHWAELAILIGCFVWSICTIYYRHIETRLATFMFVGLQMLTGGLTMLIAGFAAGEASRWSWQPSGMLALAYLTLFGSCLAYAAFAYLARNTTPARLGTYSYVNPAVACLLAWMFLGREGRGAAVCRYGRHPARRNTGDGREREPRAPRKTFSSAVACAR